MVKLIVSLLLISLFIITFKLGRSQAVVLQWDSVTNAEGYLLSYGTTSGLYSITVDTGSSTSASIGNLTPNVTYYFAAQAYNATGESSYSNEVSYLEPQGIALIITTPPNNSLVSRRSNVTITVQIIPTTEPPLIGYVEIYIDNQLTCSLIYPFTCQWLVPPANNRDYQIYALAPPSNVKSSITTVTSN
jgi:hypothetical protein